MSSSFCSCLPFSGDVCLFVQACYCVLVFKITDIVCLSELQSSIKTQQGYACYSPCLMFFLVVLDNLLCKTKNTGELLHNTSIHVSDFFKFLQRENFLNHFSSRLKTITHNFTTVNVPFFWLWECLICHWQPHHS